MEMNPLLTLYVNSPLHTAMLRLMVPPLLDALPKDASPRRILEIGCGRGDTTRMLLTRFPGAEITATDYDAAQVARAKRRVRDPRARFRKADAMALPFAPASFDLVIECNTFHHVRGWVAAIGECNRVLAPGGTFAALDEDAAFWNPLFAWFDRPESIFTRHEFVFAAEQAGLRHVGDASTRYLIRSVFRK